MSAGKLCIAGKSPGLALRPGVYDCLPLNPVHCAVAGCWWTGRPAASLGKKLPVGVYPVHSESIQAAVPRLWMGRPEVHSSSQEFFQSHRVLKSFPAQPPHIARHFTLPAQPPHIARNSPSRQEQHKRGIIHPFSKAFEQTAEEQSLLPPAQRTGGIKKEDIKTGTYRNDMFPLMSIFFFLPRLFNGLCRRGVCPSRRLLLQFHHYFSSGALVLVVPHARRVEHSLACDRHR